MPVPETIKTEHYRGDDWRRAFVVRELVVDGNGDPVLDGNGDQQYQDKDLTGWTVTTTADQSGIDVTTTNDLPNGRIQLDIAAEEFAEVTEDDSKLVFDVQLVDTTGFRRTYLKYEIKLKGEVTPA